MSLPVAKTAVLALIESLERLRPSSDQTLRELGTESPRGTECPQGLPAIAYDNEEELEAARQLTSVYRLLCFEHRMMPEESVQLLDQNLHEERERVLLFKSNALGRGIPLWDPLGHKAGPLGMLTPAVCLSLPCARLRV